MAGVGSSHVIIHPFSRQMEAHPKGQPLTHHTLKSPRNVLGEGIITELMESTKGLHFVIAAEEILAMASLVCW